MNKTKGLLKSIVMDNCWLLMVFSINASQVCKHMQVTCKDCAFQCCLIPAPPLNYLGLSRCPSDVNTEVDTEMEGETDSASNVPSEDTTEVEGYV